MLVLIKCVCNEILVLFVLNVNINNDIYLPVVNIERCRVVLSLSSKPLFQKGSYLFLTIAQTYFHSHWSWYKKHAIFICKYYSWRRHHTKKRGKL